MATMRARPRRNRNRRKGRAVYETLTPAYSYATPVLTLTFTQAMRLSGTPQIALSTGELPASAAKISDTVIEVTYTTGGVITDVTVPQNDKAIKSTTGGYLAPGTFPVS